jgi:hypothetical protein
MLGVGGRKYWRSYFSVFFIVNNPLSLLDMRKTSGGVNCKTSVVVRQLALTGQILLAAAPERFHFCGGKGESTFLMILLISSDIVLSCKIICFNDNF